MRHTLGALLALVSLSFGVVAATRAADGADTVYIVTYFETAPASSGKALSLLRELSKASRKEAGSVRYEVLQRQGQPDQFVILEAWRNKEAQASHASAAHTTQFRDRLAPLLRSPYDERPHGALGVGPAKSGPPAADAKKGAIYVVTHVDIVPKEKDIGVAAVKQLSEDGRRNKDNVRFEALTQISRPNHMTVVEIWPDKKSLEAHGTSADKKAFREKLMPMSGSLYDERLYRAVN
jgi:quinol monooxygenase YgiN